MDRLVVRLCRLRLEHHYAPKLAACLEALNDTEINRSTEAGHTIEGLINHMLAHLQMAAAWAGGDPQPAMQIPTDIRTHFPENGATPANLIRNSHEVFAKLCSALRKIETGDNAPADLDMQRLLHLVEHVSYHLGQVVLLAKRSTGKDFGFAQSGLNESQLRKQLHQMEANESQQPL